MSRKGPLASSVRRAGAAWLAGRAAIAGAQRRLPPFWWTAAAVLAVLWTTGIVLAGQASDESQLQAAFVSKFPEFVEWPPAAWDGKTALVVCVARHSPLTPHLKALMLGTTLRGRSYEVREVDSASRLGDCHVLFVAHHDLSLLAEASRLPILTVSDDPTFLDRGGIIQLRTIERRIRFEVGLSSAQRVDLRLSSQLLDLAVRVRGGPS